MKTEKMFSEEPESRTIALLTGLSIGLGIVVHRIFFLVAGLLLLFVPVRRLAELVHDWEQRTKAHHA